MDLYSPCLDWIIQCIGYQATEEEFFGLLERYKNGWNNSVVLVHILSQFNDTFISRYAKALSRLIKQSQITAVPRSKMYKELGSAIVNVPPKEELRLMLLNEVWKVVSKITVASEYVEVAAVFVEYLLQHFTTKEVDILLADVVTHLRKENQFQKLQDEIFSIVSHVLKYITDFKKLFSVV